MLKSTKATQEDCSRLVAREVHYCVSYLVSTLAEGYGREAISGNDDGTLCGLCEQAFELASPVPDYEEAVRWHVLNDMQRHEIVEVLEARSLEYDGADVTKTLGEQLLSDLSDEDELETFAREHSVEPYDREVYEHWIISRWLADKLEQQGEKVDRDFAGMVVWARCTTGQAISIDCVIEQITTNALNA